MFGWHLKDEGYTREDGYKGLGAISGVGVVLVIAFMIARPYLEQRGWLASTSTERGADAALLDDPNAGPTMRFIQQHFPEDYVKIREAVRAQAAAGDAAKLSEAFGAQLDAFYRRHAADLAQAPDADLRKLIEVHFQLSDNIHWQETACARFFTGALSDADTLLPDAEKLVAEFRMARLTAMANGRAHPAHRKTGPIEAKAGTMLIDALKVSGAPFTTIEFVTGKRSVDGMTAGMRCDAGWHLIRAIRGMPIDPGYSVYVTVFGA